MSQQPEFEPSQKLNINNASIQGGQIGLSGRDLIQGQVVNVTVYDSIDVVNLPGKINAVVKKPLTQQEFRQRKTLLNKVKLFWIKGVLEKSLHTKALIELGLEERLSAVQRPFAGLGEFPTVSRQRLPPSTGITEVFNQMETGRTLLILGEPGAGKTIMLLKLAQNLIARTEEDLSQTMPVVFNLSSWANERQTMTEWLVKELNNKYQVSPALSRTWIKNQDLLLLLDGLDEVKAEYREACVRVINEFIQEYGQTEIVVCSRIRDYEVLSTRLRLQGAINIQILTSEQIYQYLDRAGRQLEGLKTLLRQDSTLQELAKSPLMLSVMTIAYQGIPIEHLPKRSSLEKQRKQIFNIYIKRMLTRRGTSNYYLPAKSITWLNWLAQQMVQQSQTVFLVERMQPTWLETQTQERNYLIGSYLIGGLTFGLIGGLIGGWNGGLIDAWKGGLVAVLNAVLVLGWGIKEIKTVETLKWSWQEAKKILSHGWSRGLIIGLILGATSGLIRVGQFFILKGGLIDGLRLGLVYGLIGVLILSAIAGLRGPEIQTKTLPNQGIWNSAKNSAILGCIGGFIGGLLGFLIGDLILHFPFWTKLGLICGLTSGMLFGGGQACVQHLTLRLILYFQNFIPWNYAQFLNSATERIFLQKVGGGYIFIHRTLMEYFAQMQPDQIQIEQKTDYTVNYWN